MVTSTIRLGTFVTSPNCRHPVTFMRDLLALDDIPGGRLVISARDVGPLKVRSGTGQDGGRAVPWSRRPSRWAELP